MGLLKKVGAGIGVLVVVVAVGWWLGIFGLPTVGVVDVGDWGNVSDDRSEVRTELWVNNPNPIGIAVGSSLRFDYQVRMNDVVLGEGSKEGLSLRRGNQTKTVSTDLRNDRLDDWWRAYVRDDETIHARIEATATASAGLTISETFTRERTLQADSTPMIDAMSAAAASAEGTYPSEGATALYEVRRGWATWGEVGDDATTVRFHFRVHNPSSVPVPARPQGLRATVAMNGVELINTRGQEFSAGDLGPDTLLQPGETREIVLSVALDNRKIDDWFVSHVRNGERTDVAVSFQLVFEEPRTGTELALPPGGIEYDCGFRTGILVDGQATSTTCGVPAAGSVEVDLAAPG